MRRPIFALAAASTLGGAAYAQSEPEGAPRGPTQFVSAGAALLPDYAGSDDYRAIPFGALRLEIGDVVLRTEGPGLAAELYEAGPLTLGVYGRWSGGRDEVDDPVVALLPEIDNSIIAGGFADLKIAEALLIPADRVVLGARVGADVLGAFEGAAWTGSVSYAGAASRTSFFALSASVSGFSDDYADTLFSVDAAGATASGLPVYAAGGGMQDVGVTGIYDYGFANDWSVTTVLGWSQLVGDYADSPIVSLRGDENQYFLGLALGKRF